MYHRVGTGKHANSRCLLEEHLQWVQGRYPICLPGDPLPSRKKSVLLTFDDAYASFYFEVFPILKKLQIKALLAVPTDYIIESTSVDPADRMSVPYPLAMQEGIFESKAPLCTWKELDEMVTSGLVEIASHSATHSNLTYPLADLEKELVESKEKIEKRLRLCVTSFVYPFGATNRAVQVQVAKEYPYSFRIGSGVNWGWGSGNRPLKRIPADSLGSIDGPFLLKNQVRYLAKSLTI